MAGTLRYRNYQKNSISTVYSLHDSLPLDGLLLIPHSDLNLQAVTAGITHTFWVASEQLTINPTLSQAVCTSFFHVQLWNTEKHLRQTSCLCNSFYIWWLNIQRENHFKMNYPKQFHWLQLFDYDHMYMSYI